MSNSSSPHARGDFSTNRRLLFLVLLAACIGSVSALVAKLLLWLIAFFTNLLYYARISFETAAPSDAHWGIWFFLVPVVGGLVIGLMARFGSDKIRGHGIPEALEAILFGKSIMQPKVAVLKPLSSAISIGSGGPFGAEGPIIMTGGAFGSLLAQYFHLTAAERKTLLVAGAAAGMSAIFATPIAAVLLAVELMLFEWKPRSLVPVATAAAIAAVMRVHLLGEGPIFPMHAAADFGDFILLQAVGVGLVAGLFSTLLSKTLYKLEDVFAHSKIHWMWWPAMGGLIVGIGGIFEPRALGVGYDVIGDLLNGSMGQNQVIGILAVKAVIWLVALSSGTSGGVLAPVLIIGCSLGSLEAHWIFGDNTMALWALVSMGAVMGGILRSPFTAILFCFELTHDIPSLLPLLVASVSSYTFTVLTMKRSILTEKISRRGYDIFCEYMVDPLERVKAREVMTPNPQVIDATMPSSTLLQDTFLRGKHRGYPVVTRTPEGKESILGVVVLSDLEKVPGLDDLSKLTARDFIRRSPISVTPDTSCKDAADAMAAADIGRLLIVENGELKGILTRSDLLKARQAHLKEEGVRETILSKPRGFPYFDR